MNSLALLVWGLRLFAPLCVATGPGKAIFFDNTGSHNFQVTTPDISGLADQFSIALWAKSHRPADSANDNFAGFSGSMVTFVNQANTQNLFQFSEYDVLVVLVGSDDIVDLYQNGDDVDWHHYAFTYSDAAGILEFYRDGVVTWSSFNTTFQSSRTSFMQTGHFMLGRSHVASDAPFTGFLDEFCVWNSTLSSSTINMIRTHGCLTDQYSHDNLVLHLGFDTDRVDTLPDIWDSVTHSYSTTTGTDSTCSFDTGSGKYPVHVVSTAPFESDQAAQWVTVTRTSGSSINLLCRECSQVTIVSVPQWGQLKTVDGAVLGVGNVTSPTVTYDPDNTSVNQDSFSFVYVGGRNSTVMLQSNKPPQSFGYTVTVPQNGYLVVNVPSNGMSIDTESGPPTSSWIVSVSLAAANSSSMSLFQFNNTDACDTSSWDFYQCIAVDSNAIAVHSIVSRVMISDPFYRIAIRHNGRGFGSALMNITFQVFDGIEYSNTSTVTVDVEEVNRPPVPVRGETHVTPEDSLLTMVLGATDAEDNDIITIVSSLPAHGLLYQLDSQGNVGDALTQDSASSTIDQWAESATASSEWSNSINYVDQMIGSANVFPNHGDLGGAWQPLESGDFVHSWVEINITTPVYITSVHVYETWHPGSLMRVSAYIEELQEWRVLWAGESQVPLLNPDPTVTKSAISTVDLCPSIYKSRWLHFDLDLTSPQYWTAWDAVRVSGSLIQKSQVVMNPQRHVAYAPSLNYNGPESLSFTVVDCPFFLKYRTLDPAPSRTTNVSITVMPVNDPPVAQTIEAALFDGPANSINITLLATDVDNTDLHFNVTQLPRSGELFNDQGERISSVPARLPGLSNLITFKPSKITTHSKHSETVVVGYSVADARGGSDSNTVQITVQSCIFSNYTYTVAASCDFSTLQRSLTFNWSDHDECVNYDFGMSSVSCDYIPASSSVGVVVLVITCLTSLVCVFWMVWLSVNQALPIVRASQFLFCLLFVAGACALCLSNLVFLGPNTNFLCMGRAWLFHVTFTWMFGPLSMKIWRAYQILQNNAFKRRVVSNSELLSWLAALSLVDVFLLSVFTGAEPLHSTILAINTTVGPVGERVCRGLSGSNVFIILLATFKVLMCVGACFWSYQTRNVNQQFAESKHIMFAVYNTGVVGGIVAFVIYAAGIGGASAMLLHAFGVCISVLASVLVVLVPKFLARNLTTQDLVATNASVNQASTRRLSQQVSLATPNKYEGSLHPDLNRQGSAQAVLVAS
eukprot:c9640_g1_i1.p1 GENE.c9640_g1_i1~~c9640_g1_i1.p1  ORF type:complete len:1251 (-),score=390.94 c9640_g1_i1:217-3969(-)